MQVAVYAFGSAPAVAEYKSSDEFCTNFRWVLYRNGTLEILHCDDKPAEPASSPAGNGTAREAATRPATAGGVASPGKDSTPREESQRKVSDAQCLAKELKL
jgi:hypothetical protein